MPTELNISLQSTGSSVIKFEIPSELEAVLQGDTTDLQPSISFVTTGERGAKGDAGTADVAVGSIITNLIANGAVTNPKIGTAAVSNSKLTHNAISTANIQNSAVTTDKIANNAITADKIAPGVVTSELLADGIIDSDKLGQGSIKEEKLENSCVTASKIAPNVITKAKIAARTLSGAEIEENVVLDGVKINGSFQLLGSSPATLKGPNHDILNIHSERDLVFKVDSNNDQNSSYLFKNGAGVTVFSIDESGNVTINGTIDGRDLAVDGAKLDGISNSEIIDWSVAQTENIHSSNYTDTNTQLPLIDSDTMTGALSTNVASAESVKAYVDNEVAGIVDSAPGTLNTLNELAQALNDDAAFSTTVTDSIALKAPISSPTFTGTVAIPNITDVESAISANTAKTGITTTQANAITANTAKPDLTVDGAGTVHANNVPTLNQNTTGNAATATALTSGNKTINGDLDVTGNLQFSSTDGGAVHIYDAQEEAVVSFIDSGVTVFKAADNLDIGAFDFRAESFTSDAATGQAPFTVSSTTEVANLRAAPASALASGDQTINGNLAVTGTVDGIDIATDVAANTAKTSFPGFGTTAGTALEGDTVIPAAYTDAEAVSAVAAADDYVKNDANEAITGSLEINEQLFINKTTGGSKVRFRNNSTTSNRTLDVPDHDGVLATTNTLIDTKTAAYWSSSTSGFYITLSGSSTSENSSLSTASYTLMYVAPFDGKIKRISSFHQNAASGTSTFEVYIDGDDSNLTTDQRGSDMTTSSFTRKFTEDCPADWTFSKGEAIAIRRTDSVARYGVTMTIVFEYDTTT